MNQDNQLRSKGYLNMCLLLRIEGQVSSDKAPQRTRNSNNLLTKVGNINADTDKQ